MGARRGALGRPAGLTVNAFWLETGAPRRVLCLGAHSDDIEIGCGGTLLMLRERFPSAEIRWVVFSASGARATEARASASRFLGESAPSQVRLEEFRDGFFPYSGAQLKAVF